MKNNIRITLLLSFVIFAGFLHSCSMDRNRDEMVIEESEPGTYTEHMAEENETETSGETSICVFITGCIENPGVYELTEGTRLYQLVELAGGFTEEAAEDYLNLAECVKDGAKIKVYSRDEIADAGISGIVEMGSSAGSTESYVNINTADREELMTLPGIGESKADAILRYREEHGGFSSIEDIMNISGIKQGAFDKIKDLITI